MKLARTLTFAEKKVNFNTLDRFGKGLSSLLDEKIKKLIPNLAERKNTEKTIESLVNIITLIQKEAFEVGKKSAATEMKVKVPPTNKSIVGVMKKNNTQIIQKIVDDINKSLTNKGFSETGIVSQFMNGLKTLFVHGSINMGREVIFEKYPEQIYAFQYSAILDGGTTQLCRSLDDMIIAPNDPRRQKFTPPNHWNCRSIWVEILQEESHKPELKSKKPDDEKDLMKKYKDNVADVGLASLTQEIIKEEKKIEKQERVYGKGVDITEQKKEAFHNLMKNFAEDKKKRAIKAGKKDGLSEDESLSIVKYTDGDGYQSVNNILRGSETFATRNKDAIEGQIYYLDEALSKLTKYKGDVIRGIYLDNEKINSLINNLEKGDIYQDPGMFSTTAGSKLSTWFDSSSVIFNIKNTKTGASIKNFSTFGDEEDEILFRSNTRFRVLKKELKDDKIYIEMEEVEDQQFKEQIEIASKLGQIYDQQLKEIRKSYK